MIGHKLRHLGTLILALAIGFAGTFSLSGGSEAQSLGPAERGEQYREGLAAFETEDFDHAYVLWKPLAENGYAVAQYSLAKLFERGGGAILKNPVEAALWYRQAAAKGVVAAQNNLAIMYAKGEGVPRLPSHAVSLWREAAEGGHPMAQYNLALSYFNGEGIEADRTAAATWFLGAARAGVREAQYALGQLYRQGIGVEEDKKQALYWYQQASGQGHKAAREEASRLSDNGILAQLPTADGGVLLALRGAEEGAASDSEGRVTEALAPEQSFQEVPIEEAPLGDEAAPADLDTSSQALGESGKAEVYQEIVEESSGDLSRESAPSTAQPNQSDEIADSEAVTAEAQLALVPAANSPPSQAAIPPQPRRKPGGVRFQAPKKVPRWALRIPPPAPKRNPQLASAPAAEAGTIGTGSDQAQGAQTAALYSAIQYPPGSFSVWLLSTSKQREAEDYWRQTETSHPEIFADLTPSISFVDLNDLGSYYKLAAGSLPDREAAKTLCRRLRVYRPDAFCKVETN